MCNSFVADFVACIPGYGQQVLNNCRAAADSAKYDSNGLWAHSIKILCTTRSAKCIDRLCSNPFYQAACDFDTLKELDVVEREYLFYGLVCAIEQGGAGTRTPHILAKQLTNNVTMLAKKYTNYQGMWDAFAGANNPSEQIELLQELDGFKEINPKRFLSELLEEEYTQSIPNDDRTQKITALVRGDTEQGSKGSHYTDQQVLEALTELKNRAANDGHKLSLLAIERIAAHLVHEKHPVTSRHHINYDEQMRSVLKFAMKKIERELGRNVSVNSDHVRLVLNKMVGLKNNQANIVQIAERMLRPYIRPMKIAA